MSTPEKPRRRRSRTVPPNVVRAALSWPWAITPGGLDTVVAIGSRLTIGPEALLTALSTRPAEPLDNTRSVSTRDGVATIPIHGTLFRYGGFFADLSGAASYGSLARDLTTALEDPEVTALVLDVNSPGGEVDGCGELAGVIAAARGRKPILAYVGGQACSAAYWLASAADEIVAAPTAMLGCLGVRMSAVDSREQDAMLGLQEIEIVSSQTPKKSVDLLTADGRSQVQRTVDDLAAVFLADVARYRGEDPATVATRFGAGDVLVGEAAVSAGLADRLGTYEGVHAELVARAGTAPLGLRLAAGRSPSRSGDSPMAKRTPGAAAAASTTTAAYAADDAVTATVDRTLDVATGDAGTIVAAVDGAVYEVDFGDGGTGLLREAELAAGDGAATTTPADTAPAAAATAARRALTADDLRRLYPAAVATLTTAAATAERERILAIQALPVAGAAAQTLAACVAEGVTAEQAALRVLMGQGTQRTRGLAALQADEQALAAAGAPSPLGASEGGSTGPQSEIALILAAGTRRN